MEKDAILSFIYGMAALLAAGVFVFLLRMVRRKILEYVKKQTHNR